MKKHESPQIATHSRKLIKCLERLCRCFFSEFGFEGTFLVQILHPTNENLMMCNRVPANTILHFASVILEVVYNQNVVYFRSKMNLDKTGAYFNVSSTDLSLRDIRCVWNMYMRHRI